MSLPNFFCIGAQKAATTLLHELLKNIDNIYLPNEKEIHFFDENDRYIKGLSWYDASYFKNVKKEKAIGEITPSYIFIDDVAKRINDSLGKDIKFIVILRNPIDRAYSHYAMKYRHKEESKSFSDAIVLESMRVQKSLKDRRMYSYLQRGLYAKQINNYLKYFDKNNFMFIEFEDFIYNQDIYIKKICDFLSVKKPIDIKSKKVHNSQLSLIDKVKFQLLNKNYNILSLLADKGYPKMDKSVKILLKDFYKDDIKELENIINKDLSKWLQ